MTADIADLKRLRVDQVGALRAPLPLRKLFEQYNKGELSEAAFISAREKAIEGMIRKQESLGFPVVTDGELRRRNFQDSFNAAVSGFDRAKTRRSGENENAVPFSRTDSAGPQRWRVPEKLRLVRNVPLEEFRLSKQVATGTVKVTLINADRVSTQLEKEGSVYRDIDAFMDDVIAIEHAMIAGLVAAGCRYIQLDAPGYTAYVDEPSLAQMRAEGLDPQKRLARAIAADNEVIAGFDNVVFGLHVCRGGARTIDPKTGKVAPQWHREGHYDAIAEQLFSELKHDRLLLEYDSDRAGGFAPLRFIPRNKVAVLGLVTTKSEDIESPDSLKRRIDEAARYLPLEHLALSPQCGFGGYRQVAVEEDIQWRKFEVILETAQAVWN